jgi:CBS domain-containing protein
MKVKDVMSRKVLIVRADAPLKDAAMLMAEHRISGLPVVDFGGHVVGVLSEGDILFKEAGYASKTESFFERWLSLPMPELDAKLAAHTAGEAMTAPAVTIGPTRPLTEAANAMIDNGVKRLPVVDAAGNLVGIVTRADLVRAFVRSDEAIAREIRDDVIRRSLWIEPDSIEVVVERGEVRLAGEVETKAEAELIPEFVQRVPGVVSVLSKLRWSNENGHQSGPAARLEQAAVVAERGR